MGSAKVLGWGLAEEKSEDQPDGMGSCGDLDFIYLHWNHQKPWNCGARQVTFPVRFHSEPVYSQPASRVSRKEDLLLPGVFLVLTTFYPRAAHGLWNEEGRKLGGT